MTLDPSVLAAVKQAAEAATPGPWFVVDMPWNDGPPYVVAGSPDPHVGAFICDTESMSSLENPNDVPDAAYVVAACNAAPALIAEIERLTAQVEAVKALHRLCASPMEGGDRECGECCEPWPCDTRRALAGSGDEQEQR